MAKAKFSTLIKQSDIPVLVDFYADWCGPCKVLSPIIQKVAGKLDGQVKVIKINVDRNKAVTMQYNVRSMPTLMLFYKGKVLWRQSGVMPEQQLLSAIRPHLAKVS
ncbi:MAG: thioredoxin [Flammeovirgaceae bacterium]